MADIYTLVQYSWRKGAASVWATWVKILSWSIGLGRNFTILFKTWCIRVVWIARTCHYALEC
jgi:hypothetical protein